MTAQETFQIPIEAAEAYEAAFVPALFAEWAPRLLDAVGVSAGDRVLDVACGTGIVARTAAERVRPGGSVVGLDLNEAMLTVARRTRPDLDWRQGDAAALPFADGTYDVVVCQMALMFFPDRVAALREMARVGAPGARVGLVVPAALADQPAYRVFVEVAERHAGPDARSLLGAYWSCGDVDQLRQWVEAAGLQVADVQTHVGTARFGSVDDLVSAEVESTPLRARIDDDVYRSIRDDARPALAEFTRPDGALPAPLVGHVVVARVPAKV